MSEQVTILDTILTHKRAEVADRRVSHSLASMKARSADMPPTRDFLGALREQKRRRVALIAEVKKASPSAGIIREDFDPIQIAQAYKANGADCLSILTDERFFQGADTYLTAIRRAVALPLLRKDFTVDAYQIYEARALGADAVLLIVAALTREQIAEYQNVAHSLRMTAFVEVHTEAEMEIALCAEAKLVGINSRDLKRFVTDLGTVERLAAMTPAGVTLVAESGIKTSADVAQVARAGAQAILVGETLMRAQDIGEAIKELLGPS